MKSEIKPGVFVHYWDWKEQPCWPEIVRSLSKIHYDATITEIETGNDEYAIVITDKPVSKNTAKECWKLFCNQE